MHADPEFRPDMWPRAEPRDEPWPERPLSTLGALRALGPRVNLIVVATLGAIAGAVIIVAAAWWWMA